MKKIYTISLVLLSVLLVYSPFVHAIGTKSFRSVNQDVGSTEMESDYDVELDVVKGWNLIMFNPDIKSQSEVKKSDILVVYYYAHDSNRFIRIYPNPEPAMNNITEDAQDAAMWVYSKRAGILAMHLSDVKPVSTRKIYGGWNLLGITPDLGEMSKEMSFSKLAGNCNFSTVYFWDDLKQKWVAIPAEDQEDLGNYLGYGLVFKAREECKFRSESVMSPIPSLPE